ncbi:uncharacterized protein BT62DRAFT_1011612 [Guyanagaster necrorhizus]|uniref:Uncharacterized protein n=1 Tax=Guyanagaster necrorhizus TaxID=856835 RepID=A0A9P8AP00_9AGAR|nr:uncharacterized protein BT62DRAFT_1011612 [Guyanagaster necrorhizus MCA 3950]KAG7441367.1 hypothetical protein BT62DRAFT_1011612 [Guyanagaster necrorhizus MCA 3950]
MNWTDHETAPDFTPTIFCIPEASQSNFTRHKEVITCIPLGQESTTFRPLVAKIVKRLEPFTSSVLLIQQVSDGKQFMLKLNDRRLGHRHSLDMEDGEFPWTTALEEHLRAAVQNIQLGTTTNWFDLVKDWKHPAQPDLDDWEDWMWEILTWTSRMEEHQTEVKAYRLLRRLQGRLILRFYGLVHLPISSSQPLHPISNYIPCLIIEDIQGVSMGSLKPGVDIPRPEAEALADRVMDAFRTMKAGLGQVPGMSDEEWENSVSGSQNTRFPRRVLMSKDHGVWRRKGMPLPMNYYYSALMWNEYVENQPEDYCRQTFERVPGTDWEGAREEVLQWRVKPELKGVRWGPCMSRVSNVVSQCRGSAMTRTREKDASSHLRAMSTELQPLSLAFNECVESMLEDFRRARKPWYDFAQTAHSQSVDAFRRRIGLIS